MYDLNLPQPGPWRPVPLGEGILDCPGICPDGDKSRYFLGAQPASGFSAETHVNLPAHSCRLGPSQCSPGAGHSQLLEVSEGRYPWQSGASQKLSRGGTAVQGMGEGPHTLAGQVGDRLAAWPPICEIGQQFTLQLTISSNCDSKITSLGGGDVGLWARLACVPRAPQVQLRATPGWLLDCGEVVTPWAGQRGAQGGPAWLWPRCSGRRVGRGPVACTPVTAPVPQSLWSRRHGGSYQELVTVPPWAAGPAENASAGDTEVPVTPQAGGLQY